MGDGTTAPAALAARMLSATKSTSVVRTEVRTHQNSPSIVEGVAVGRGSNIKNINTLAGII